MPKQFLTGLICVSADGSAALAVCCPWPLIISCHGCLSRYFPPSSHQSAIDATIDLVEISVDCFGTRNIRRDRSNQGRIRATFEWFHFPGSPDVPDTRARTLRSPIPNKHSSNVRSPHHLAIVPMLGAESIILSDLPRSSRCSVPMLCPGAIGMDENGFLAALPMPLIMPKLSLRRGFFICRLFDMERQTWTKARHANVPTINMCRKGKILAQRGVRNYCSTTGQYCKRLEVGFSTLTTCS